MQAFRIREILTRLAVPLIINDRVDVALAVGADGVHVGQDDMPYKIARKLMGPGAIIGPFSGNVAGRGAGAGSGRGLPRCQPRI